MSADSFRVRESLAFVPAVQYISIMTIDSVNSNGVAPVQEMAAVKTLKNTLQFQEKAAMRLLVEAGDEAAEKNVVSYPDRAACFLALGKDKVSGCRCRGVYSGRSGL